MFPAEKADHSEALPSTVHQTLLTLHTGKIQTLCPQVSRSAPTLSGPPARPHIRAHGGTFLSSYTCNVFVGCVSLAAVLHRSGQSIRMSEADDLQSLWTFANC